MNPSTGPVRDELPEETALRRLLDRAVADLEPADRLDAIRSRTAVSRRHDRSPYRAWTWGALGAAVATAAAVSAVAVLNEDAERAADPGPANPAETPSTVDETVAAPVYYAGDTLAGTRLFREFQRVPAEDRLTEAVLAATERAPLDPDYRSLWPEPGLVVSAAADPADAEATLLVVLADDVPVERPGGMSADEARLAVQQVVYTLQGAAQARAPVSFRYADGRPVPAVFGVATIEPVPQANALEVLSLMSITTPEQGAAVPDVFVAEGAANSFEATVDWVVRDGDRIVADGFSTATGSMEPRLFPWTAEVDLSAVPPGTYVFEARTADPSGGTEGFGPHVDTKTITVR